MYHLGKANVIADTLSCKRIQMSSLMIKEQKLIEDFRNLNLEVPISSNFITCNALVITNEFLKRVKEKQLEDLKLKNILSLLGTNKAKDFFLGADDIVRFQKRICIPEDHELKQIVLSKGHKSKLNLRPGMTKMYQDLKKSCWWPGMKDDVANFFAACLTCQKSKVEHQQLRGMLAQLEIPVWKLDIISMDFVTHLPHTLRKHNSIWVIVDRLIKTAHFFTN